MFGRTNNPWDLARTPGGSSGGAAGPLAFFAKTLALLGAMTLLRVLLSRMRIDQTIGLWWRGGALLALAQLLLVIIWKGIVA